MSVENAALVLRDAIADLDGLRVHNDGMLTFLTQESVTSLAEHLARALAKAGLLAAGTPPALLEEGFEATHLTNAAEDDALSATPAPPETGVSITERT